jgi:hypothetical protein
VPIAVGGDVSNPGALVVALPGEGSPAPYPIYMINGSQVVRIASDGSTSIAATLPFNPTAYFGMTAYAPEPGAAAAATAALAALAWRKLSSRSRRRLP